MKSTFELMSEHAANLERSGDRTGAQKIRDYRWRTTEARQRGEPFYPLRPGGWGDR